jgi:hypothetical protein
MAAAGAAAATRTAIRRASAILLASFSFPRRLAKHVPLVDAFDPGCSAYRRSIPCFERGDPSCAAMFGLLLIG